MNNPWTTYYHSLLFLERCSLWMLASLICTFDQESARQQKEYYLLPLFPLFTYTRILPHPAHPSLPVACPIFHLS